MPPWRPWKGQGKVTGNQRVRKAQEFCIGFKYHALSNIKPFAFEGLRAGGEGFWSSQETCREGQGLWEMCVCVGNSAPDPSPGWSCGSEILGALLSTVQRLADLWGVYL